MAMAHERSCRESAVCDCSHSRRSSSTRIFTNGHLHHLVTYCLGLLYSTNSLGIKGDDKARKKEIKHRGCTLSNKKAANPMRFTFGKLAAPRCRDDQTRCSSGALRQRQGGLWRLSRSLKTGTQT